MITYFLEHIHGRYDERKFRVEMSAHWEYRVVGINIATTKEADAQTASQQMPGMSEKFIKEQFPEQYVRKQNTNMALQCQRLIAIYGKKGWEHYQQGQLGNTAMLYFKRKIENEIEEIELSAEEKGLIQSLDPEQKP